MSERFPTITAQRLVSALKKLGFVLMRQRGSHAFYYHPDGRRALISMHPGDMNRHIVKRILKDIELSEDELRKLL